LLEMGQAEMGNAERPPSPPIFLGRPHIVAQDGSARISSRM